MLALHCSRRMHSAMGIAGSEETVKDDRRMEEQGQGNPQEDEEEVEQDKEDEVEVREWYYQMD